MIISQEQRIQIEDIIKECSGYKGNEYLLDKIFEEVVRRTDSLISGNKDIGDIKIYLKRVANIVILEITNNPESFAERQISPVTEQCEQFNEDKDEFPLSTSSFSEIEESRPVLSVTQVNLIKNSLKYLEQDAELCGEIFRLRYLQKLSSMQIAARLGIVESEVDNKLVFLLSNLSQEV